MRDASRKGYLVFFYITQLTCFAAVISSIIAWWESEDVVWFIRDMLIPLRERELSLGNPNSLC